MRKTLFFGWTAVALLACSSKQDAGASDAGPQDASVVDVVVPPALCATDPRAEAFTPGLAQLGKVGLKAILLDMNPAPAAKGDNVWTVQITDKNGANVDGANVTVKTWMPDHGHSSSILPLVTPMGSGGKYTVSRLNLFMPGIWQITLNVTTSGNLADSMMYTFCVGG